MVFWLFEFCSDQFIGQVWIGGVAEPRGILDKFIDTVICRCYGCPSVFSLCGRLYQPCCSILF